MSAQPLLPRSLDHHLCVLVYQRLKRAVVLGVLLNRLDLVLRHVAADRLTVLPALQVVVRPVLPLAHDAELARLHALNFCDLLKKPERCVGVVLHSHYTIYISIYYATQFLFLLH